MRKSEKQKKLIKSQKYVIPWAIGTTILLPIVYFYTSIYSFEADEATRRLTGFIMTVAIIITVTLWLLVMSLGSQIEDNKQNKNKKKKDLWW